jgi:malonate-semialdehyde dehydrogenase (acetylating) / methylmalonate-semialdehyde dehydrogenase
MDAKMLRNYIGGRFVEAERSGSLDVENPSTGEVIARTPLSKNDEVARAVAAARAAFPAWSTTPASRRVEPLFRLAHLLHESEDRICRTLVEEMGKSLPDARAEMKRSIENVETACGMPVLQMGEVLVGAAADIDGAVLRLPVGVFGMIAPFNFPAMVPFWFIPYAIASGNTYVLKPSERVPCTMSLVAEIIDRTGLPPGVFNLVHGDREAAQALMTHPDVAGISFVGSTRVGRLVAETCVKHGKRFQVLGSAKNHLVVMPDARLDEVVRNMVTSCFGCAGQRCMASSAIVAVGEETEREVTERFVRAAREVVMANPLDPAREHEEMLLGPVISARARDFIEQMIQTGIDEGARCILDGRGARVAGCERGYFVGPTVFAGVRPGMAIHRTEIFGPVVVILSARTYEEALAIVNAHEYGNGASIYTQSGYFARRFKLEARAGMIGVNVGIPAPVAALPFGGTKASFLSDIKAQGEEVIRFFTETKIVTERFWPERA